jgi:hypothetical protein
MKCPIFYYNAEKGEHISPESAGALGLKEALRIFAFLGESDSFLGVEVNDDFTVQVLRLKDGMWWLELLDKRNLSTKGVKVNVPMAERAIELVFNGDEKLEAFSEEFPFLIWRDGSC